MSHPSTHIVATSWTFSDVSTSRMRAWADACTQYTMSGRTTVEYKGRIIRRESLMKLRLRKASMPLTLVTAVSIWSRVLNEQSTRAPWSFARWTCGRGTALPVEFGNPRAGDGLYPKFRYWQLTAFERVAFFTTEAIVLSKPFGPRPRPHFSLLFLCHQ